RRFELLAMPHLGAAFNLARWLTGNTADAEDVVQDAYLRALLHSLWNLDGVACGVARRHQEG
ncbi:MAG TPA: sigma factor, partial [Rhodopila sp.]